MLHFHDAFIAAANPQGFLRQLEQDQRERHFKLAEMRAAEYPQPQKVTVSRKPSLLMRLRERWQSPHQMSDQACTA